MGLPEGLLGPKIMKSTTELGERQKEVLKRVSGGIKIPIGLIGKMGPAEGSLEGSKGPIL